ncbi:histidine phosphatase family protein [Jongsikchunia kroppenstedtii]|uniref:histidine phosphatase family protein n=1 Tax=Jongsikchunia kroppenstedtii TaxID=1121721 RepID=UPI0005BA5015|nr:histidine phosphatase family protein [Jongsikchunia kroppenstedtii]
MRLRLITAARTAPNSLLSFDAADSPLDMHGRADAARLAGRGLGRAMCGPELSVQQTAEIAGLGATVTRELAGPDLGHWRTATPDHIEPADLRRFFADPTFDGHGGESVVALVERLGRWLRARLHEDETVTAVVTGPAAQGIVAAAFDDPARYFAIEVAPATVIDLSYRRHWRLLLR